jgi:hypothetical protein
MHRYGVGTVMGIGMASGRRTEKGDRQGGDGDRDINLKNKSECHSTWLGIRPPR